jgi:hypothetical protein
MRIRNTANFTFSVHTGSHDADVQYTLYTMPLKTLKEKMFSAFFFTVLSKQSFQANRLFQSCRGSLVLTVLFWLFYFGLSSLTSLSLQSCPGCPEGCFCILNLTRLFSKFILFQPSVQEDI